MTVPAPRPLDVLLATLDLEEIDTDLYRGTTPPTPLQRVFGGQVAGQALVAAQRTVPERIPHSLHAYFIRPGATDRPIVYQVERMRDGRSYTTRRVVALQGGKPIFNLQASFQVDEGGTDDHVRAPGGVADPDSLAPAHLWYASERSEPEGHAVIGPFDLRDAPPTGGYDRLLWIRVNDPLPADQMLQRCVAAYASDLTLLAIGIPGVRYAEWEPTVRPRFMASLDHAVWFHRPFRVDNWVLYAQNWVSSSGGRALTQGRLFTGDGRLGASVVQEGVIRF